MIGIAKSIIRTSLLLRPVAFPFTNESSPAQQPNPPAAKPKSYWTPEPSKQPALYLPRRRSLSFTDGRMLIYLNKQNLSTPYLLDLHFTVPLVYFGYLILTNPFYLVFPAAMPMLIMLETILLLRWVDHKAHHKRQLERIYLLEDGCRLEFVYANKIRRYAKGNEKSTVHLVSDFKDQFKEDVAQGKVRPHRGTRFPDDLTLTAEQAPKPSKMQYGWTIRDKIFNIFVLPAEYEFADWEILMHVLNGQSIYLFDKNTVRAGAALKEGVYPTIEEEERNIPALRTSMQEDPGLDVLGELTKIEEEKQLRLMHKK